MRDETFPDCHTNKLIWSKQRFIGIFKRRGFNGGSDSNLLIRVYFSYNKFNICSTIDKANGKTPID